MQTPIEEIMQKFFILLAGGVSARDVFSELIGEPEAEKLAAEYLHLFYSVHAQIGNDALIAIFRTQDTNGMTFAMLLAKFKSEKLLIKYFELLKLMIDDDAEISEIHSLMQVASSALTGNKNKTIPVAEYLAKNNKPAALYFLLANALLPENAYPNLLSAKYMLADYILHLDNEFIQRNALRDALDATHSLGKLFNSYYFYSNVRQKMSWKLSQLENKKKIVWQENFFPQAKKSDIDSYLEFRDPFQMKI